MSVVEVGTRVELDPHDEPRAHLTWSAVQGCARAFSRASHPIHLLGGAVACADACVVIFTYTGASLIDGDLTISYEVASITLLATVLTLAAMGSVGSYTRYVAAVLPVQIGQVIRGWFGVFLIELALGNLTSLSPGLPKNWAISWYVAMLIGIIAVRLIAVVTLRHWRSHGKLMRTVAVVNLSRRSAGFTEHLRELSRGEMRFLGTFIPDVITSDALRVQRNGISDLIALSRLFRIDDVLVVVSGESKGSAEAVIRSLSTIPTNVHLCPEMPDLEVSRLTPGLVFGHPVMTIAHRPLMGWNRVAKRTEDVVLSLLAISVLWPLMVIVAVMIKLESAGPILFYQKRLGFNNDIITIYKFRSMIDAQAIEVTVPQATRSDPRVTRVGRIIRRTSIDELPQLINVLQGRMSLVGPRPHALAHNDQYAVLIDGYLGRHRVQPGITGWAQVNGYRGETDTVYKMQRRIDYDLGYIDSWSILFDMKVLFKTVILMLFDRNAY